MPCHRAKEVRTSLSIEPSLALRSRSGGGGGLGSRGRGCVEVEVRFRSMVEGGQGGVVVEMEEVRMVSRVGLRMEGMWARG